MRQATSLSNNLQKMLWVVGRNGCCEVREEKLMRACYGVDMIKNLVCLIQKSKISELCQGGVGEGEFILLRLHNQRADEWKERTKLELTLGESEVNYK